MKTTISLFLVIFTFFTCSVSAQNPQTEELTKLYGAMEFEKTIEKAREFIKDDPQNMDYNALLGRALVDVGQPSDAIPFLKYVAENDNSWRQAWSAGYLGSAYFLLSDIENSKAALQKAMQINITANATKYANRNWLLFGFDSFFDNWKTSETKHIRFHFQNISDSEMELFMQSREKAFETVNSFFGSTLPKKIDLFVWHSKEDAMKILKTGSGFADPQFCVVHLNFQQTRGHELTHVISNYSGKMLKKTGLINEGTAVCFDLSDNKREEMVKTWLLTNKMEIDINDIWVNWGKYPQELTYPLSGLFVEELIKKFGKEKFLIFFGNQTYENAKTIFGVEIDILIQEFQNRFNG